MITLLNFAFTILVLVQVYRCRRDIWELDHEFTSKRRKNNEIGF